MSTAEPGSPPLHLIQPGRERLLEAVERLVSPDGSDRAHARRFLEYARESRIALDELWSLEDERGRLRATALAVPGAGRIAMVFATRPAREVDVPVVGRVIEHASAMVAERDVTLAQSLVEPSETRERQSFVAGGFRELATLSYLERPLPQRGEIVPPPLPEDLQVAAWDVRDRGEMLRLLDATYESTLDCPGLCGLRRTEDILDGHMHSGRFERGLWLVLRERDQAIGVMLLSPAANGTSVELVYLGLAAPARGRGLGLALLRHGLAQLAGRRERVITLAVDESNDPALRLYREAGFHRTLRRIALVRPVSVASGA